MRTSEIKFYPKRVLTAAQQQRLNDHKATVMVDEDGTLKTTVQTIITPKGLVKEVSYKSIKTDRHTREVVGKILFDKLWC